jgi:beta-fructofuranosidase
MSLTRRNFLKVAGVSGAAMFVGVPKALNWPQPIVSREQLAADPLRPQFHLLPARNWMNDPNGPIYWKGNYHMFFQYNPNAAVWGDMHWAHAISTDMIRWKHLPVALAPTPGGYDREGCFSGSAVDDHGTATLLYTGVKSVPPQEATLRDGTHNFLEVQCLATSKDTELRTWEKLPAPVLLPPREPSLTGFSDPCLWRMKETWYMGIGSGIRGEGGRVLLYRSENLHHWEYVHPLASGKRNGKQTNDPVDTGEMWECPDFFALGKKHVLLYSTERKVYWQVGELDLRELVFHAEKSGLLDHGAYYAPKTQRDAEGRRILWGWIPETRPEAEFSAAGWAGCMSLPRVLTLDEGNTLRMAVIPEIADLRETEMALPAQGAGEEARAEALQRIALKSATAEIEMEFQPKPLRLKISDGAQEVLAVAYDPARHGQESRLGDRGVSFPSGGPGQHRLRIFLDGSVAECFLDEQLAWTWRTYRAPKAALHFEIPEAQLGAVDSLRVWPLRPISPDRLTA